MQEGRRYRFVFILLVAVVSLILGPMVHLGHSQAGARIAQIPGIDPGSCNPGPEEKPWLNPNQSPGCRALEAIAGMSLEEKLAELGGITGRGANKRLGLISGGGSDGPNGIASMGSGPPQARGKYVTAFAKAVAAAKESDIAIVFAAEQMGEGQDKIALALPGDQDSLIQAVAQASPRTIVVLHNSNPISMPWLDKVAAVIEAFYPGQEAGSSIARLLFGDANPSGKLAMTFPANEQQGPGTSFLDYPGDGMTVNYTEGVLVGYRWYDAKNQEPLFPFGYGLSYTTFRYSDLQVEQKGGDSAIVKVRITDSGKREGAEVVQLYLGSPATAEEPPKQLKGFEKIFLKPGESKVVTMQLDKNSLAAWDAESHQWKVFPGIYSVMAGSSSRDIRLRSSFAIGSN